MFTAFDYGRKLPSRSVIALLLSLALSCIAVAAPGDPSADEPRLSATRQIPAGGRDGVPTAVREDVYTSLRTVGERGTTSGGTAQKAGEGGAVTEAGSNDFWFYSADVVLFGDDDRDGYYHGIDLLFDADSYYDAVDVYAVAFLSYEGGPWNEYASTDVFTLYGATGDDQFDIVTELTSGYPAGDYDLLIELYDAIDGAFLASFGPSDTSELAFLPLEDFNRDAPHVDQVVVVDHGGGAAGPAMLALLTMLLGLRCLHVSRARGMRAQSLAATGGGSARRAARMTLLPQADKVSK